jgi:hypothetical protein
MYMSYAIGYNISAPARHLLYRNPVIDVTATIGDMGIDFKCDLVVSPTDILYGLTPAKQVYSINRATAVPTFVCTIGAPTDAATGCGKLTYSNAGQLYYTIYNGATFQYELYTVNLGGSCVGALVSNSFSAVTQPSIFGATTMYSLQNVANWALQASPVGSMAIAGIGPTNLPQTPSLATRLYNYCINGLPTLELYRQTGDGVYDFQSINITTGAPTPNGVTLALGTGFEVWGVSSSLYCAG